MYSGYKFKFDDLASRGFFHERGLLEIGDELYQKNSADINAEMEKYLLSDGYLNGTEIQDAWFPQIEADIFLSHSHADEDEAKIFSGFMSKYFDLSVFIDSCVWGNVNELLREIDNDYCMFRSGSYSYEKRNYSTSHVHMMLSTALMKMIDATECLMFMDTPNSLQTRKVIETTNSPWIYAEMVMSHCMRRKEKDSHQRRMNILAMEAYFSQLEESTHLEKSIKVAYLLDTLNLETITPEKFDRLINEYNDECYALDTLYDIIPMRDKPKQTRGTRGII